MAASKPTIARTIISSRSVNPEARRSRRVPDVAITPLIVRPDRVLKRRGDSPAAECESERIRRGGADAARRRPSANGSGRCSPGPSTGSRRRCSATRNRTWSIWRNSPGWNGTRSWRIWSGVKDAASPTSSRGSRLPAGRSTPGSIAAAESTSSRRATLGARARAGEARDVLPRFRRRRRAGDTLGMAALGCKVFYVDIGLQTSAFVAFRARKRGRASPRSTR